MLNEEKFYHVTQAGEVICSESKRNNEGLILKNLTWKEAQEHINPNGDVTGSLELTELIWQQSELAEVQKAITDYLQDSVIPEIYSEIKITTFTEDDYYSLLGDRKLLVEYLEQIDFPECGRPDLSGIAKATIIPA